MLIFDPAKSESVEELALIRGALEGLFKAGQISDMAYFKSLVMLASRYAKLGDLNTARSLVTIPTEAYYRIVQVEQMREDRDYEDAAVGLASAFVEAGIVDPDVEIPITQWMADA